MNEQPQITVLMPAWNAASYIRDAIESVLVQDHADFELLIINDGSTDETESIIRSYDDTRIKLINQSHQGIAAALNMGLLNANAPFIARFDADDICYKNRLSAQYRFMTANPDHVLIGSDVDYVDRNGEGLYSYRNVGHTHDEIAEGIVRACPFVHSSVMYLRSVALELGGYDTRAHSFEDYHLWTKFIRKGKVANLAEPMIAVRLNPESVTIDEKLRGRRFIELRKQILFGGKEITVKQEKELLAILQSQDFHRYKNYSYNILVAKKYLWNNYQPVKARENVWKAISSMPFQGTGYGLLVLSCLPQRMVNSFYKRYKLMSNP